MYTSSNIQCKIINPDTKCAIVEKQIAKVAQIITKMPYI